MKIRWRQATSNDLPEIDSIGSQIHADLPEKREILAEKIRLFPEGALILQAESRIAGYGLAHPWKLRRIPQLNAFLNELPADSDCLHIHDVAVLPEFRGQHAAESFVVLISALATKARIDSLTLVSVHETDRLWAQFGFRNIVISNNVALENLRSYGRDAQYMICDL